MVAQPQEKTFSELFVGMDEKVPILGGTLHRYTNLDSAASTPALKAVRDAVNDFLVYYSSVHRGMGFKSQLSTYFFEQARAITMDFLCADPQDHICIFVKNATEALNILAHRIPFTSERDVLITSGMEHHSNDLPWRNVAEVVHIASLPDGRLDMADFDQKIGEYGSRTALVSISGASNVSGFINPIGEIASKAHAAGARFAVDCAQLAPHRSVDMGSLDDPEHVDYAVISAHKLYAPYGSGALVGRKDTFEENAPFMRGGGTVKVVTYEEQVWDEHRDEAGSPNTVGAVAMAAALKQLQSIGMDKVADHEIALTLHALSGMLQIPGLNIFGSKDLNIVSSRLGVIPFSVDGLSHVLVAAILGYEFGIGARNGRFCAYPYTMHLIGLSDEEERAANDKIIAGNGGNIPGLVRVSFGLYNTHEDVDHLLHALACICKGEYRGIYQQDPSTGDFIPEGWAVNFEEYFSL